MRLPAFSVKQPVATLMLFIAIILIGVISFLKLNVDMFPEVDPPVITIITSWPGANASDVETEVTNVIENNVNAVNNLDTLTSKSVDNMSLVTCKFDWGTKLDEAANDIRDKLELSKRNLPRDIDPPMLFKFSSATAPIMIMSITGDKSWPRLHHIADKQISDELKRVPGVGSVILIGGLVRRINIYFDMNKVNGFHLPLQQINQVLAAENLNIPAGSIKSGANEYYVRVPGRYGTAEEIKNTIVGRSAGRPVYLRDVADVTDAYKDEKMHGWSDGKKAIILALQKQSGKNTITVIDNVKKKLENIRRTLPADVGITFGVDNSENILASVKNLRQVFIETIFCVILVAVFFLRSVRSSVIISLTIPFSLTISLILLYLFGYTINIVSLMALTIALGLVVDDGIVILENIVRHIERGGRPMASAIAGASEMGMAVTATTMTIVVVFLPLMFVTGLTGIFFKQLAFVLVSTILASLFTALSMTPMLASRWIRAASGEGQVKNGRLQKWRVRSENWFGALENGYGNLLNWSLAHRKTVITIAVVLFLTGVSLIPFISTAFIPQTDTGDIVIALRLPEGTRIEETTRTMEKMLTMVNEVIKPEEVRNKYLFNGQSEEGFGMALGFDEGPNVGQIGIKLVDRQERKRSAKAIATELRKKILEIPGISDLKVSAQDPITTALMGGQKPIVVEIQGAELDACVTYARQLEDVIRKVPGAVDVGISQKAPRPELRVDVDREKASTLGLNMSAIAGTLRNYFYGMEATWFRDAGDRYDIFTRLHEKDKDRLAALSEAPLFTPDGRAIRLKNIARIGYGEGPVEIQRKNRQKIVKVEADTFERSLGDVTGDIKTRLARIGVPSGLSVNFGSDVEEQHKAFRDLALLLILGIALVYMVLAALYRNLRDPLIIMFSLPFAATGVLFAFFFGRISLDLMTFMGMIMLAGIVVKNAIILIDYTNLLRRRGESLFDAVTHAGKHRLRPILMTSLAMIFGMVPMALSRGVGAEFWRPLGVTMISGLMVSTLVTLILIPTVYYLLEKRKR